MLTQTEHTNLVAVSANQLAKVSRPLLTTAILIVLFWATLVVLILVSFIVGKYLGIIGVYTTYAILLTLVGVRFSRWWRGRWRATHFGPSGR